MSIKEREALPAPIVESARLVGDGPDRRIRLVLAGAGTVTMTVREALRPRLLQARCMERLLVMFPLVDRKAWFYQILMGLRRDEERRP